jgi:hypothetical protein
VPPLFTISEYRFCGTCATIPAKMIIEIPLPIPSSVISSPSQTANIVPAVIVTITDAVSIKLTPKPGIIAPPARPEKAVIWAMDCKIAIGIVAK